MRWGKFQKPVAVGVESLHPSIYPQSGQATCHFLPQFEAQTGLPADFARVELPLALSAGLAVLPAVFLAAAAGRPWRAPAWGQRAQSP